MPYIFRNHEAATRGGARRREGGNERFPTLVIECGYSDTMLVFRKDVKPWHSGSHMATELSMAIKINKEDLSLDIMWNLTVENLLKFVKMTAKDGTAKEERESLLRCTLARIDAKTVEASGLNELLKNKNKV